MIRNLILVLLSIIISQAATPIVSAQEKISAEIQLNRTFDGGAAARVMVIMKPPKPGLAPSAAFSNSASYIGSVLKDTAFNTSSISNLPIIVSEVTKEGLDRLLNDPNVAYVIPDIPIALPDLSVDVISSDNLPSPAGVNSDNGQGTMIAILDTGVDTEHPVFRNKQIVEACFSTKSSQLYRVKSLCPNQTSVSTVPGSGRNCSEDVSGCEHGTHVASIALGNTSNYKGIAPAADLMAIQVFTLFEDPNVCGTEARCVRTFPSDQAKALKHVLDQLSNYNIASTNMSLGGGRYQTSCDAASELTFIIQELASNGVTTVIASGNDGYFNAISSPGCVSSAVTVTATKANGELDIRYANMSGDVDIAAQGTEVYGAVLNGQYARLTGTSMATPAVAGLLGIMKQIRSSINVAEINRLFNISGPLVRDPRTNVAVPAMDKLATIANLKQLNQTNTPVSASSNTRDVSSNFTFLNAQSIIATSPAPIDAKTKAMIETFLGRAIVELRDNNTLVIETPSGFTGETISKLKSVVGPDTKIFENAFTR